MSTERGVEALMALGFTALEAEVYCFLLEESPATGYRVAQSIGRPVANTYKAIEALQQKGAVLVDEGSNRQCRAIPAAELLAQLDRGFTTRRRTAAEALSRVRGAEDDTRIYQLRSRAQVHERSRSMLARAQSLVLIDVMPDLLEELRPDLEAVARRGVRVVVKTYRPTEIPGVQIILNPSADKVSSMYPGQWLVLFIDGAEHLLAALPDEGEDVLQAVWTGSVFLSWLMHTSVSAEFLLAEIMTGPDEAAREAARPVFDRFRHMFSMSLPGYQSLVGTMKDSPLSEAVGTA